MSGFEAFPEANRDDECYDYSMHQDAVQGCWCTLSSVSWHQAQQNCFNGREQHEHSHLWICAASCSMCFAAPCELVFSRILSIFWICCWPNWISVQSHRNSTCCPRTDVSHLQEETKRQQPDKENSLWWCFESDGYSTSDSED